MLEETIACSDCGKCRRLYENSNSNHKDCGNLEWNLTRWDRTESNHVQEFLESQDEDLTKTDWCEKLCESNISQALDRKIRASSMTTHVFRYESIGFPSKELFEREVVSKMQSIFTETIFATLQESY